MSSDYAAVFLSNTPGGRGSTAERLGLVQNAQLSYQHNVQPRFEVGSHELYFLTGQSIGAIGMGRLVGERGILEGISFGNAGNALRKGVMGAVEFKFGRLGLVDAQVRQDVVTLSGVVLQQIALNFGVGSFDVSESLSAQAAMASRTLRV